LLIYSEDNARIDRGDRYGNVAAVTVSFAVPAFPVTGSAAVTVTGPPAVKGVADPLKPAALLTVATEISEDVHVT